MQRQRIILIIGIALALIAVFMINLYLNQQRQIIMENARKKLETMQANQISVLVAKNDIPRGSIIEPKSLEAQVIPNQFMQPQAVTTLERIAGMITIAPISKGEQITLSKLTYTKQAGGLAEVIPVGKRAITISVDNIASLVGMIKAGDYVDVIVLLPVPVQTQEGKQVTQVAVMPLFQNVLVLAVGQQIGTLFEEKARYKKEEERKSEPSSLITLALSPQEANLIAFVHEQGKIRLILRSPADSKVEPIQPVSWDTLFQYLMPKEAVKPELKKEPESVSYVEIYRGLKREKVPLSQ